MFALAVTTEPRAAGDRSGEGVGWVRERHSGEALARKEDQKKGKMLDATRQGKVGVGR